MGTGTTNGWKLLVKNEKLLKQSSALKTRKLTFKQQVVFLFGRSFLQLLISGIAVVPNAELRNSQLVLQIKPNL